MQNQTNLHEGLPLLDTVELPLKQNTVRIIRYYTNIIMATGDFVYKETSKINMHKGSRTLIQYLRSQTNKTNKQINKHTECLRQVYRMQ